MNRKNFITSTVLTAFSLSTFGRVIQNGNDSFTGDCTTTKDILGPFYRPNAPERSDLTHPTLKGSIIEIKGRVSTSDCVTPISGALVEIWHCNAEGEYDNTSNQFHQRATFKTNSNGEYSFKTILPGKYLNGKLYRPAHIHFRVRAEQHKELISQLYFEGDPHITEDPWASSSEAAHRILPFQPLGIDGGLTVTFNINLAYQ